MLRNFWFQLHWLTGISAGLVIAFVGVTGAMLSFQDPILKLINPGVMTVSPAAHTPLSPDKLLARLRETAPERQVNWLALEGEPRAAARVNFADPNNRRGQTLYLDPYSGELLGEPRGREFFITTMQLHRWLLAGDVGKQIVGASTIILIGLCLTGLYLRWPRQWSSWRNWLTFSFKRTGRSFLWDLHAVLGTWALLFYLLASVTGLYWSYGWYRDALFTISGVERPTMNSAAAGGGRGGNAEATGPIGLDGAWSAFNDTVPGYSSVTLRLPQRSDQPVQLSYLDPRPQHERANNRISIDPRSGAVLEHERYADKPLNERLMGSMLPLHSGSYFGNTGLILMFIASLGMPLFAITGWMLYLDRRRKKGARKAAQRAAAAPLANQDGEAVLIGFASQSGSAERYAWLTAGRLQAAGVPVSVKPLGAIGAEELGRCKRALFALATFGDGEAPDNARAFARRMAAGAPSLPDLQYGILALGDRAYDRYCGFAHTVSDWRSGARALFAPVEVDNDDASALATWQQRLAALIGGPEAAADWQAAGSRSWRLVERYCLNPGSSGQPTFHLALEPADHALPQWQAGDLVELRVQDAAGTEHAREYSIASVPADARLLLLVRQARRPDGSLGLGSGWLTEGLPLQGEVSLRLRSNSAFRGPADDRPLILIGNGTGLAGLRSHLKARVDNGQARNWLIFGERNAAHDFYYRKEILAWRSGGMLQRLDLAFSRDGAEKVYVQHKLSAAATELRQWLAQGAAIYVCGSAEGMAQEVDTLLRQLVGEEVLERMLLSGQYRRDVY